MRHILTFAGSDAENTPRFLSEHLYDNFAELMILKIFFNFGQGQSFLVSNSDSPRSVSYNVIKYS